MVFTSIPAYLDPSNWQQVQPNFHHGAGGNMSAQLTAPALPPPPPLEPHGNAGVGSVRPGSMADRARMENIPMPETALKCPRCESTNTKFCYFNNYSLSQPRHFCKTCRRYWTKGGALRNVPVGGGCRRNKRIKGSSSKSPVIGDCQMGSVSSSAISSNGERNDILGLGSHIPTLRFMAPLHNFAEFPTADVGPSYRSISAPVGGLTDLNFQIGPALSSAAFNAGNVGGSGGSLLSPSGLDQWRLHQGQPFPFFCGLDSSSCPSTSGLYSLGGGINLEPLAAYEAGIGHVGSKTSTSGASQFASVKMEEHEELNFVGPSANLSRQLPGNEQYWGNNAWTDLSGFNSSCTSNPL